MSQSAIRRLTLIVCATALVTGATIAPADARTSSHKKHTRMSHIHQNPGFGYPGPADQTWPEPRRSSQSGDVCPGIARSFECKIWPPPIDQDPDRKASGSDGG